MTEKIKKSRQNTKRDALEGDENVIRQKTSNENSQEKGPDTSATNVIGGTTQQK